MSVIERLLAREILDSRGRPTLKARCLLKSGAEASVSVPAGASTGRAEALELRDGDPARYGGLGCRKAVKTIVEVLQSALSEITFDTQADLDQSLLKLDGTPNKARLGANTTLAVSLAFARAVACEREVPLYQHFADVLGQPLKSLPRPTINLFSGGRHAGSQVPIQDVLVVPTFASTVDEVLAATYEIYRSASRLIEQKYNFRPLSADEGGLAPPFTSAETMIEDAIEAIRLAGFEPGKDVKLAIDVASSQFYRAGLYQLGKEQLDSVEMIERLLSWVEAYPLVSVEDGLAEEDWNYWPEWCEKAASRGVRVMGDDLLCTNPVLVQKAINTRAADTLLLKVNQIGTLSEAAEACRLARGANWQVCVSARSGETEDEWLADLATGWAGDQIKVGSITQSERLAKYNRLLEIEAVSGLILNRWPN